MNFEDITKQAGRR